MKKIHFVSLTFRAPRRVKGVFFFTPSTNIFLKKKRKTEKNSLRLGGEVLFFFLFRPRHGSFAERKESQKDRRWLSTFWLTTTIPGCRQKNLLTEISLPSRLTTIRNFVVGDESGCVVADDARPTPTPTRTHIEKVKSQFSPNSSFPLFPTDSNKVPHSTHLPPWTWNIDILTTRPVRPNSGISRCEVHEKGTYITSNNNQSLAGVVFLVFLSFLWRKWVPCLARMWCGMLDDMMWYGTVQCCGVVWRLMSGMSVSSFHFCLLCTDISSHRLGSNIRIQLPISLSFSSSPTTGSPHSALPKEGEDKPTTHRTATTIFVAFVSESCAWRVNDTHTHIDRLQGRTYNAHTRLFARLTPHTDTFDTHCRNSTQNHSTQPRHRLHHSLRQLKERIQWGGGLFNTMHCIQLGGEIQVEFWLSQFLSPLSSDSVYSKRFGVQPEYRKLTEACLFGLFVSCRWWRTFHLTETEEEFKYSRATTTTTITRPNEWTEYRIPSPRQKQCTCTNACTYPGTSKHTPRSLPPTSPTPTIPFVPSLFPVSHLQHAVGGWRWVNYDHHFNTTPPPPTSGSFCFLRVWIVPYLTFWSVVVRYAPRRETEGLNCDDAPVPPPSTLFFLRVEFSCFLLH